MVLPIMHQNEKEKKTCIKCQKELFYMKEPICKRCGRSIEYDTQEFCYDCAEKQFSFQQGKAIFSYKGKIKSSLYRFKYGNRKEYADFYADEMEKQFGRWVLSRQPDVILPIPLHAKRKKVRGYNQAEEIAKSFGIRMNIPMDSTFIVRNKNTTPQKQLSMQERKKNLKNAFKITQNNVNYKCVILVDDIYTTGSTINEAAWVLKNAGVENIYFICVSIGKGY